MNAQPATRPTDADQLALKVLAAFGRIRLKVSGTSMLVMFPLVFTSNIFVEPDTMPGWMEAIVEINPVSDAATAVRGLVHGNASGADIGSVLLACAIITAIFAPLTMYLYRAKSRG